ncbi:MAG TPA: DNA recombination protein RmuC [Casimicrobiaceae bacterium]|nr:DNA recombination protein RmuC [Casimicrobiaceae bacterium]
MLESIVIVGAAVLVALVVLSAVALLRLSALARDRDTQAREAADLRARLDAFAKSSAEHERDMRADLAAARREQSEGATALRLELGERLSQSQAALQSGLNGLTQSQSEQLKAFSDRLAQFTTATQQVIGQSVAQQSEQAKVTTERVTQLSQANEQRLEAVRATVDKQLEAIRNENAAKLEEVRKTVDDKLHATLEQRLGDSFKLVSERLEQVHRGLGEMQTLATGVGDLKRVLSNVKTRGTWGEVQLGALLADMLSPGQYAQNVQTRPSSRETVEYAVRLPGRDEGKPCWLPIDAKFPLDHWQRLQEAVEHADAPAVETSRAALERFFKLQAKSIRDKYIESPYTTDFAILFIPTEGLFAEAVSRPGLADTLQREYRITLAGPTNLVAILSGVQLVFRTIAIEKRSTEVWRVLAAVKSEFFKFGEILAKTKKKLDEASNTIEDAGRKTRTIENKLRDVEILPADESQQLLELGPSLIPGVESVADVVPFPSSMDAGDKERPLADDTLEKDTG